MKTPTAHTIVKLRVRAALARLAGKSEVTTARNIVPPIERLNEAIGVRSIYR
jgi:hypothetical protein